MDLMKQNQVKIGEACLMQGVKECVKRILGKKIQQPVKKQLLVQVKETQKPDLIIKKIASSINE